MNSNIQFKRTQLEHVIQNRSPGGSRSSGPSRAVCVFLSKITTDFVEILQNML